MVVALFAPLFAEAHRSGCHAKHSCPSDSGSYVCGDLGYTSECPVVSAPAPVPTPPQPTPSPVVVPNPPPPSPTVSVPIVKRVLVPKNFVGIPTTKAELNRCLIVGNGATHIYHLKGSSFIKTMNLKKKTCFATEREAQKAGYRKSKIK